MYVDDTDRRSLGLSGVSKSRGGRVHLGEDSRIRCSFHCRSSGAALRDIGCETATAATSPDF